MKKLLFISASIIIIIGCSKKNTSPNTVTPSGTSGWTKQNLGTSYFDITDIFFVDQNTGWVVGSHNMILHTTDGGTTWVKQQTTPDTNNYFHIVFFVDKNFGWALGPTGFIRTTNGGALWGICTYSIQPYGAAFYFTDANNGWANCPNYIGSIFSPMAHTTDGGITWTKINVGIVSPILSIKFTDSNHGWASTGDSIISTTDGGLTWSKKIRPNSSTDGGITFISDTNWMFYDYSQYGYYFHSTDGGLTWNKRDGGMPYFFDDNNGWRQTSSNIIEHTKDGGLTWVSQKCPTGTKLGGHFSFTDLNHGWVNGGSQGECFILHTNTGGK